MGKESKRMERRVILSGAAGLGVAWLAASGSAQAKGAPVVQRPEKKEAYHEKLEEDFVFPRFERAGKLVELVAVLRAQHQRGRGLTDQILRLGTGAALNSEPDRRQLAEALRQFNRLYRPRAALFGEGGFEKMVAEVAKLERALGIYELSEFTAKKWTRSRERRDA